MIIPKKVGTIEQQPVIDTARTLKKRSQRVINDRRIIQDKGGWVDLNDLLTKLVA